VSEALIFAGHEHILMLNNRWGIHGLLPACCGVGNIFDRLQTVSVVIVKIVQNFTSIEKNLAIIVSMAQATECSG
jgi:hypothetical protein